MVNDLHLPAISRLLIISILCLISRYWLPKTSKLTVKSVSLSKAVMHCCPFRKYNTCAISLYYSGSKSFCVIAILSHTQPTLGGCDLLPSVTGTLSSSGSGCQSRVREARTESLGKSFAYNSEKPSW